MSAAHAIAAEALVFTAAGPCAAASLQEGVEVLGVDVEGGISPMVVSKVSTMAKPVALARILTGVGEALLPARAEVAGVSGPIPVSALADSGSRLEIVAPADLPPAAAGTCEPLEGLLPGRFLIPAGNGIADLLRDEITAAASQVGVVIEEREEDRWRSLRLQGDSGTFVSWAWSDERRLIEALCGWEVSEGRVTCARVRLDQRALQRRLFGSFAACNRSFSVEWLPGYLPVECRLRPSDEQPPAFARAQHVIEDEGEAVALETREQCALIVGPLIVPSV